MILVDAVAHEQHGEALRERGGGSALRAAAAQAGQGFEPRQGHGDAGAAEDGPPGDRGCARSFASGSDSSC